MGQNGTDGSGSGTGDPFGSGTSSQLAFSGTFYDLKQTPNRKPTNMTWQGEFATLRDFFLHDWNEDTFKQNYLSSSKPIFTNEIMIPFRSSNTGPAAFGMQNRCKPGYWIVLYHVTINPTRSGDFRLAGYGDDYLVVRANGVNVLDSGWYPPASAHDLSIYPAPSPAIPCFDAGSSNLVKRRKVYPPGSWLSAGAHQFGKAYGQMVVGDLLHIDAGTNLTLDVLVSDAFAAGDIGRCGFFLFLLEDGKDYPQDADGNYVLPALQLHADPTAKRTGECPPFTCKPEDALVGN